MTTCVERIAQEPEPIKAVAYMRTSSATNIGSDKDSERRQRSAIEAYAKRAGITVVEWLYDPAVSRRSDGGSPRLFGAARPHRGQRFRIIGIGCRREDAEERRQTEIKMQKLRRQRSC
jgi:hypothetical protein